MTDINSFREKIQVLVGKFERDKTHYLSKGYPEAQVRIDFVNPFFEALGWDIENEVGCLNFIKNSHPPSAEREKIEREIAIKDEKIDEIVYGLYGITEEERKAIER